MSLIFITGMSGTGKSTVKEELTHRGYLAYDTDENELTIWTDKHSGQPASSSSAIQQGTPEWYETYLWTLQTEKVRVVANQVTDRPVFMCGIPGNWREAIPMFDMVFCLTLDNESLEHRLTQRTNNDYGKAVHELRDILEWNKSMATDAKNLGAILVDASLPVGDIVDTILSQKLS